MSHNINDTDNMLSLEARMLRTVINTSIILVITLFNSSKSDDPLCVEALMNGTYDSCADRVTNYPKTWGICELNNCHDKLQLLLNTNGNQRRNSTRKVIHLIVIYCCFPTQISNVINVSNLMYRLSSKELCYEGDNQLILPSDNLVISSDITPI